MPQVIISPCSKALENIYSKRSLGSGLRSPSLKGILPKASIISDVSLLSCLHHECCFPVRSMLIHGFPTEAYFESSTITATPKTQQLCHLSSLYLLPLWMQLSQNRRPFKLIPFPLPSPQLTLAANGQQNTEQCP